MTTRTDAPDLILPDAPGPLRARLDDGGAVAWSAPVTMPTYRPQPASEFPMYLDRRVYQGSSGRVYPLPFVERIDAAPTDTEWQAVHLENRYLRVMVLPELGGRIHIGFDKTTGYDFFYRNSVIKPALVGLTGPWISGGVEFNWPQHHRPATFLPVETTIEEGEDGSVTVWCSDHDPFARMKGMHGVRLHPDRSTIELVVRLHNRTSERQSFLWWANVAARVGDDYQSFFPQDVHHVADHARRAISAFPEADREYYGVDYPARAASTPGADRIDWYRNIPVPTSYMIVDSQEGFFGGYDHARRAGFVHWADRRISPGKKQWTWGDAPFGHAWDALLTDEDGPYVELMAGVFTDNQPDFSWLRPGEVKTFSQYWYPIPAIGIAHQANRDAALHVEVAAGHVSVDLAVTRPVEDATVRLRTTDGVVLVEETMTLSPGTAHTIRAERPSTLDSDTLVVEIIERDGRRLISWTPPQPASDEPAVAVEPPSPADTASVDELYLTGAHLDQYRHPTRSPLPYWDEALRRDPGDWRVNLAFADRAYRTGDYQRALGYARTALQRLTARNSNPADTEAFYTAGLILDRLGATTEAVQSFAKASWDGSWAAAAGYEMARIAARHGETAEALADLDALAAVTGEDSRRRALRIVLLRRLGRHDEAAHDVDLALVIDPLDVLIRFLADGRLPSDPGLLTDLAIALRNLAEDDDAATVFSAAADASSTGGASAGPIAHYLRAELLDSIGRGDDAAEARRSARQADRRWAFPQGLDAHDALVAAIAAEADDAVAAHLLGMLLYDNGRRDEAVELWDRAIALGLDDIVLLRNAGLAAYNVLGDHSRAWELYSRASALAPTNARLLYELDQLAQRLGHPSDERLARLEGALQTVLERDDLTIVYLGLLVDAGRADDAVEVLDSRSFQPWEGGEGLVLGTWERARTAAGLPTDVVPANLGEGRPVATPPAPVREDGTTDYFATSLPEQLLFYDRV
ncbi:DUF5107 domain-containing protein [Plantibacter flavus]|uniref:DUF5107 domain-containing protein n=1 Tax=Plantibacter flavus TaxID=150123 RepID=UPI003F152D13